MGPTRCAGVVLLLVAAVAPASTRVTSPASPQLQNGVSVSWNRGRPTGAAVTYTAPVSPLTVVRAFSPPATRYGPGHLGVDLRVPPDGVVDAAAGGVVTFSGMVAGRGVIVVQHPDGIRTEYEPVLPDVAVGTVVGRGQRIGTVDGTHRGCPGRCLHWGARRGAMYLDPLTLLRPLGPVRLLPWQPS